MSDYDICRNPEALPNPSPAYLSFCTTSFPPQVGAVVILYRRNCRTLSCNLKLLSIHSIADQQQVYNQCGSHFPSQMEHKYTGTENHRCLSTKQPVSRSGLGVRKTKGKKTKQNGTKQTGKQTKNICCFAFFKIKSPSSSHSEGQCIMGWTLRSWSGPPGLLHPGIHLAQAPQSLSSLSEPKAVKQI